jgi:hypothetical protein
MYLLLATAFEFNQRGGDSARTALGWAGYLARKQGDPFTLIEVADVYLVRDTLEVALPDGLPPVSAGALLDQAGDAAPDRYEPILLSILLAEKTNDPGRMAAAVERLMELAWPGYDETWRGEARRKAEALAQKLEQQGKSPEATTLLDRLEAAETRDLFIRLTWQGDAGIDLVVDEPLGASATVLAPRTVFGGAIVKSGRGKRAESVYSCPRGFDGDYAIRCETLYNDQKDPARDLMLEVITHEGMPGETRQTHAVSLDQASPIVVKLSGARRKRVLPFQAPNRAVIVPERLAAGSEASTGPVGTPASRAAAAADILRRTPAQPPDSLRPDDPQAVPKSNR